MDPDADFFPGSSPPPQSNSGVRRRDRRVVSAGEVALLPNSSRRASSTSARNKPRSAPGGGATHYSTSNTNNLPKKTSSALSSSKKPSASPAASSGAAHHRSNGRSSDRRHRRSSQHSTDDGARSAKDDEQHRSSRHHPPPRSSSHHNRDNDNKRRSDIHSSSKTKTSSGSLTKLLAKKISRGSMSSSGSSPNNNDNKPRRISSSSSRHKQQHRATTRKEKVEKQHNSSDDDNNNNNNNYEVFYDEHGRKIKVPKTTTPNTTTATTSSTPYSEGTSEDYCGYNSSDFDSDTTDHHSNSSRCGNSSSSGIDGASDFEDDEEEGGEEEDNSDYIDGASELDDDDDNDDNEKDEYDKEYDDVIDNNYGIDHDGDEEEDIEQCNYINVDATDSDEEEEKEEYVVVNDDGIFSKEQLKNKGDVGSYFNNTGCVTKRSNSPELNDTRRQSSQPKSAMERMVRNFYGDEITERLGDDPPTKTTGEEDESILFNSDNRYNNNNMDPNEDEGATLRLNRPPTPESDRCNDIGDNFSQMSVRGQDPPEEGRGCDPPFVRGTAAATITAANSNRRREHRVRKSVQQQRQQSKEEKKPELRGILKKKDNATPPPIAYFGRRTSQSTTSSSEQNSVSNDDAEDSIDDNGGSDPDFSEVKPKRENVDDDSTILSLFEDKSVSSAKSSGGLRTGRFAAANAAAAATATSSNLETIDDGDSSTSDEDDHDCSTEASSAKRSHSNSADFNTSFPSLVEDDEHRFNRNKSHFLRTSDLGLTQDTIFAQQFLDNPGSKPEPHYHHPSPHPPPGIQFNCDENWISVDDGNGGHSPIAPQAVDALVATGYRIACDPMMWTPTSKTRKFMTEHGMRFDDVPTPAPPEEEGGRGDSSCMLWSGKFPHKHYGHDLPVIRSQGIVNMSADQLVDLLMDSTRVQSYNVSSMGRKDELMLSDGTDLDACPFIGQRKKKLTGVVIQGAKIVNGAAVGFEEESDTEQSDYEEEEEVTEMEFDDDGKKSVRMFTTLTSSKERRKSIFVGVTKLVRSTNKVPMRKSLEYVTLLHCRALTDDQGGNGYIIVGRAVTPAEDAEKCSKDVQRAEILLNVHIIRRLREKKSKDDKRKRMSSRDRAKAEKVRNRCLMINVVHVKSPIIPNILAKKVSLSAAASFITDIRALTDE